jgi:predicted HicB family RNase H-like nuclease
MNQNNYLQYKGYIGNIEFEEENAIFYGKVIGINSLVSYEGDSATALIEDFQNAVDEYLLLCDEKDETPETPYNGIFNVHIEAKLHEKAVMSANSKGMSLNKFVEDAIRLVTASS